MLDWLLAPVDASRAHDMAGALAWHARLMVASWGILVPLGILCARFLKLWPGQDWPRELDHPGWWHLHRAVQYSAGLLMLGGLWLVVSRPGIGAAGPHGLMGWATLALGAGQFLSAWLRGSKGGPTKPASDGSWHGDHYDMTRRRLIFEYWHKFLGYLAAGLAIAAILSGLWRANAPHWMWLVLGLWWMMVIVAFHILQRRGLAFDTYQAHWGTSAQHPGNRRVPIGFGIRRQPVAQSEGSE